MGLGVWVGAAWPYSSASSLLGGVYLPGPQMLPEFKEKDSQNVHLWMDSEVLSYLRPRDLSKVS